MTEPPRPPGDDPTVPHPPSPEPTGPGSGPGLPPPGYQAPPPGYQPPPGPPPGYGTPPPPPGYGQPPPAATGLGSSVPTPYANPDDKVWVLVAHFGGAVISFIAPLITFLAKGDESSTVRAHSVEALNFQLTWAIASVVASVLAVCSFGVLSFLLFITLAVMTVGGIIGGIKAADGQLWRYPASWRVVR